MQMIIDEEEILGFTNWHLKHKSEQVTEQDIRNYFGEPEDLEPVDDMMSQFEQQLMMSEIEMEKRLKIENDCFFTYEEMLLLPWQVDYNNRVKRNN